MKSTLLVLALLTREVVAVRNIRIVSPLQSLTIWNNNDQAAEQESTTSPRARFLPKYKAGLEAEAQVRQSLAEKRHEQLQVDATSPSWSEDASVAAGRAQQDEDRLSEEAFDRAVAPFQAKEAALSKMKSKSGKKKKGYQFVGVINSSSSAGGKKPITWYARKKPSNSSWSVRLVHVNRDAILKDLFDQGKIDIFSRYDNTGRVNEDTGLPVIRSEYSVRQRSWKNLWNFSPKHLFTDSSGNYWRERRLTPGMYTDGKTVYEASYRYRDGRNGMSRRSTFQQFLNSPSVDSKTKKRILDRLQKDSPDIVLED